jgi:hypothetical protein
MTRSEERFRSTTSWFEHGRWYVNGGVIFPGDDDQRCPACHALVGHAHFDDCTIWPQP